MAITTKDIQEIREQTGLGVMDIKKALEEAGGNKKKALEILAAQAGAKMEKRADRITSQGKIGTYTHGDGKSACMIEVNSETDFVARNAEFQNVVGEIAKLALKADSDVAKLSAMEYPKKNAAVSDHLKELVGTIGENLSLRRTASLKVKDGVVATYVHNQATPGMGKIGVLVALESTGDKEKLNEIGRQVAMHVAATNPLALKDEDVDPQVLERERAIFTEQAKESGKPEKVIKQMIEGRIKKFYQEVILLKQAFVVNPDLTVEKALKEAETAVGAPIAVTAFVRYELGEGIKADKGDFAAEVAAAAGKQ